MLTYRERKSLIFVSMKIPSNEFGFDLFAIFLKENYEKHVLLLSPSSVFCSLSVLVKTFHFKLTLNGFFFALRRVEVWRMALLLHIGSVISHLIYNIMNELSHYYNRK
jgi:hypothetical protein